MNKKYIAGLLTYGVATTTTIPFNVFAQEQENELSTKNEASAKTEDESIFGGYIEGVGNEANSDLAKSSSKYLNLFKKYGRMFGIDPYILMSISSYGSGGNPSKVNGGNYGLMQVNMGEKERTFTAYNHNTKTVEEVKVSSGEKLLSPELNIKVGAMELQSKLTDLDYNIGLGIQAYNMGQSAMKKIVAIYLSNGDVQKSKEVDDAIIDKYIQTMDSKWMTKTFDDKTAEQLFIENGGVGSPEYWKKVLSLYSNEEKSPWVMNRKGERYTVNLSGVDINFEELYKKSFSGSKDEIFNTVHPLKSGGFIVAGETSSSDTKVELKGKTNALIAKYNEFGELVWAKTVEGNKSDKINSIIESSDGSIIAVGETTSTNLGKENIEETDAFIVKYSSEGEQEWLKVFGGKSYDKFKSVTQLSDGDFIVVGYSNSKELVGNKKNKEEAIIVKYDEFGEEEFVGTLNGNDNDELHSVYATNDGGFIAVGESFSDLTENKAKGLDAIIVKFDKNMEKEWLSSYGSSEWERFYSVIESKEGGYIAVGKTSKDSIIVKFDNSGNKVWDKILSGNNTDVYNSVVELENGNLLVVGESTSIDLGAKNNGEEDAIIVSYSADGDKLNMTSFGGANTDVYKSVAYLKDGSVVAVGGYQSDNILKNKGGYDAQIVKYQIPDGFVKKEPRLNAYDERILINTKFDPLKDIKAFDFENNDISDKIKVLENTVDTSNIGTYSVLYEIVDKNNNISRKRVDITVVAKKEDLNHPPVINTFDLVVKKGGVVDSLSGISASDKEDGSITNDIKVLKNNVDTSKVGVYEIKYQVTDSNQKTVSKARKVTVRDEEPSLTLTAPKNIELSINEEFNELNIVKAIDKYEGDLTENIKIIENNVDTSKEGEYFIVYEVENQLKEKETSKTKVVVKNKTPEKIEVEPEPNFNPIYLCGATAMLSTGGLITVSRKMKKENN